MTGKVLVLRPQPAAEVTAERARGFGLAPIVAPLFRIEPLPWNPPPFSLYDAVMVTSASAARWAGDGLTPFRPLPCYAVGEASATAARDAGFANVRTGPSDGAALAAMMARDGVGRAFHPAGEDRTRLPEAGVRIDSVPVYAARAETNLPADAARAIDEGALVLLHSPRAAACFAGLVGQDRRHIDVAAISPAVAAAAGSGWRSVGIAPRPRDEALLELAAKLCQTKRDDW